MDTQILKMDKPYNYIFCNGYIGLHIATMIVYSTKTNDDGSYELETHSHPIVKYVNSPGGTVWNKAELTNCMELCNEEQKKITLSAFVSLLQITLRSMEAEESSDKFAPSTVDAIMKLSDLMYEYRIGVEWPVLNEVEGKSLQDYFDITLIIEENPDKTSPFKYICYDYGGSDMMLVGGVDLPFSCKFNTKEELRILLRNCVTMYYSTFSEHQFKITFSSFNDNEFSELIDEVNKMEPELREDCNEIDV